MIIRRREASDDINRNAPPGSWSSNGGDAFFPRHELRAKNQTNLMNNDKKFNDAYYLQQFRQFEQTHSMENVIYNELRMRGYSVDVGVIPIAEKDKAGKVTRKQLEVDFVCNMGSVRYYIQSAYSLPDETKRIQEIRPFRRIDDSFKKIVITKDIVQPHYDEYGILTINIYDFLLDPHCIEK